MTHLASVMPVEDIEDWMQDVRARAEHSRSMCLTSDPAVAIGRALATLLPKATLPMARMSRDRDIPQVRRSIILSGDDHRLQTKCGVKAGGVIRSTGNQGVLLYGPYVAIGPGSYRVRVFGTCAPAPPGAVAVLDVTSNRGSRELGRRPLPMETFVDGLLARIDFAVDEPVADLEVHMFVSAGVQMTIESIDVVALTATSLTS